MSLPCSRLSWLPLSSFSIPAGLLTRLTASEDPQPPVGPRPFGEVPGILPSQARAQVHSNHPDRCLGDCTPVSGPSKMCPCLPGSGQQVLCPGAQGGSHSLAVSRGSRCANFQNQKRVLWRPLPGRPVLAPLAWDQQDAGLCSLPWRQAWAWRPHPCPGPRRP